MPAPIALQLYTLRADAQRDFEGTVRVVAEMGFVGVEPAGFPGTTPEQAGNLFRELNLAVPSAHTKLPLGGDKQEVLEAMAAISSPCIVSGRGPDDFSSLDRIRSTCELFNEAAAVAGAAGLTLAVHNHWWEYTPVDGIYPYRVMLEHLDPRILFQVDTYWVQTGGCDVAAVLRELGDRAPLLHIKDGPCIARAPMTAVGAGAMDFPSVLAAAGDTPQWLIVEQDRTAGDMVADVRASYDYLVGEGLAIGKR